MTTRTHLAQYEAELNHRELELLRQKKAVAIFVAARHTTEEAEQRLAKLRQAELRLAETMVRLFELSLTSEFKKEAEQLCAQCRELGTYTRDMDEFLARDLASLRSAEERKKAAVVRNVTFLFVIPGSLIATVQSGVGHHLITPEQAGAAGLAISGGVLLHKKVVGAFVTAAKAVCSLPKLITRGFLLLPPARELVRARVLSLKSRFHNAAEELKTDILRVYITQPSNLLRRYKKGIGSRFAKSARAP